ILVDGILVEQNTKSWNGIRDTATALRLGNPTPSSSAAGLDGLMDNVRIYDYARTPAQIAWDYNRGAPVGHWRFDECQGTTAYDVSGNDNHGTINIGATAPQTTTGTCTDGSSASAWYNGASGKWNSSLSFDGEDDYIEVGGDSTINVIDSITVSAWIFPEQYKYAVIAQKTYNTGLSYSWAYKWRIEGQDLYFGLYDTGDSIHRLYFDPKPNLNEWTHIVATYDGNIGKAYQNGIETDSFESSFSLRNDSNGLLIGGVDGGSEFFDGQIDDVRIYNYALTDEQVKTLYNQGAVHFGD
ncbi:MAG: hypothetical protein PHW57_03440, partial [Candidatus Shapirobacteria bacterium]|nr:hypothetical protein [Candidatus Shapirobacteria bacterium]